MQEEAEIVQTKSRLQALLYFSNVAFYGGVTTKFTYNVKIPDSKTTMIYKQKIGLRIVEMLWSKNIINS